VFSSAGIGRKQLAVRAVPMERLGLSAVARFLEDGMLLLVCSRSALEGASAGTVMCEANGERWRGLNECALKGGAATVTPVGRFGECAS
jgi:hypothetical protein